MMVVAAAEAAVCVVIHCIRFPERYHFEPLFRWALTHSGHQAVNIAGEVTRLRNRFDSFFLNVERPTRLHASARS